MIISQFPTGSGSPVPQFTYTGEYRVDVNTAGWKIKFLTSGTLVFLSNVTVDIFAVGGGGGGNRYFKSHRSIDEGVNISNYGGGGGSGYTTTERRVDLSANTQYAVTIGEGGVDSDGGASSFASLCVANGGIYGGANNSRGYGGSGGASSGQYQYYDNGAYYNGAKIVSGGTDGSDGSSYWSSPQGRGQGTTTREFGESVGDLYASGGSAYFTYFTDNNPETIPANSGNGGNGGRSTNTGASGIVIIRNVRA